MVDTMNNLRDCRHYATMLCAARIARRNGHNAAADMIGAYASLILYDTADPSAWPMLDAVKRVMEIDQEIDRPGAVLMLAGIDLTTAA